MTGNNCDSLVEIFSINDKEIISYNLVKHERSLVLRDTFLNLLLDDVRLFSKGRLLINDEYFNFTKL